MDDIHSQEVPLLLQKHQEHLQASAISIDVIKERGYRSISIKEDFEAAGFNGKQQRPGLLIPNYGVDGSRIYCTLRPDSPRIIKRNGKTDRAIKYEHPKDTLQHFDVHPRSRKNLKDPNVPIFIVEGIKKADALVSAGAECVIALPGVWNWRGKNKDGGKTLLADFDFVAWNNRDVYIGFDSDMWSNINVGKAFKGLKGILEYKKSRIHALKFPDGKDGKKIGADDFLAEGHTLQDVYALETKEIPPDVKQVIRQRVEDFYEFDETGYKYITSTRDGIINKKDMANFMAKIIEDIVIDDGQTSERRYKISGMLTSDRTRLPIIEVPAENFKSLSWIDRSWGHEAFIYTGLGRGVEEQFITAIRMNSINATKKSVYTHTGWREINGKMEFLTAAGALDNPNILVELDESLQNYNIPSPPPGTDLKKAVETSLDFMNIGATKETQKFLIPLWAEMYLAPLCHVLRPTFTQWIYGESGSFKSTVSALALCHFGIFDDITLPSNFLDTENSIEQILYWAKDLPVVIDDWAPGQNIADAQKLEKQAERLNRSQGNRRGRRRFKNKGEEQTVYRPRGIMLVTAEQLPRGQSNTARIISIKMKKGDIDVERLTEAQKSRESYRTAMAGYISWLKEEWVKEDWSKQNNPLIQRFNDFRNVAYKALLGENQHPRIPQMLAFIYTGLDMGLAYAREIDAMPSNLIEMTLNNGWDYLLDIAKEQNQRIQKEKACQRFLEVLKNLIHSSEAKTDSKSSLNKPTTSSGIRFIGWEDENYFYLLPKEVYAAVFEFCRRTGEIFTVKDDSVWEQLQEMKLIVNKPSDTGPTTPETIACYGHAVRVLKLKKQALEEQETPDA
jgi:hypothetical protein